jgi:hypothetical protein
MFAEVSLQGAIVQRVWRYDDTIRFYLSTRRATDGAADDPAQTHLIDVPMGVTRALPIGRLTVGMNIYVQARLIHRERVETLAHFLKQATGPRLDTSGVAVQQVRNNRTQTQLIAQSIVIRRPGRESGDPYAEANLLGRISDRIWRHDDQLHFRLLVKQDQGDQAAPDHLDYFTIMLPISVTRLLPLPLQPGMLVAVQATPIVREHPETLTTFLRTSADRDLFPRPEQADEIMVTRRKVDFLAKMIMIRESERPRRKSRRAVESPVIVPGVSAPGLALVGESVEPAAAA